MNNFEVFIGFDFGTSFSKICYTVNGDLYVYKKNGSPFIPTEIYYSIDDKEIYINKDVYTKRLIPVKYFKYSMVFEPIINKQIKDALPSNLTYQQINILFSIYFLACTIKEIKQIIKDKYKNINDILWEINMSAPINDYSGEIYDLYYNVLNSAYILSDDIQLNKIHINLINEIYNNVKKGISKKNDVLSIHPELFVEAVYFTNNNLHGLDYGSYMVMDIGGGTVDIGILWKRKWDNNIIYDLVVINILKYGLERFIDELKNMGIKEQDINDILKYGKHNEMTITIKNYFKKNLEKMISIEEKTPKAGIDDIINKRIYYTGGGCKLFWYKNILSSIDNKITEDEIQINLLPLNYDNSHHDVHRLIIAIELARPVDTIKKNLGSTKIINADKIITGEDFTEIEVKETNIGSPKITKINWTYNDLQDRQKELYGDDPI